MQSIKDNKNQYLKDEFLVIYDSIPASELDMIFRRIVCMPPDDPLLQGILKSEKNQPKVCLGTNYDLYLERSTKFSS